MAETAIKSEEEKKEYFDSPKELDEKVTMLAEMIVLSNKMCFFTGAGISTSSGIPDYRSGYNTVLETGPGCWETAANKKKYQEEAKKAGTKLPDAQKRDFNSTIAQAIPNLTHMTMVELQNRDHLKMIISQNVDGLHRKSGIHPDKLCELHGNTNLETCSECEREQMRDYKVRCAKAAMKHMTGRMCEKPGCKGGLKDSIINFGDNLNQKIIRKASDFANNESDLMIAMGSSMRVQPAATLPLQVIQNGGNFVMINLQKTPIDAYACLVIHAKCDDVMKLLMQKLGYKIPSYSIKRQLNVTLDAAKKQVEVGGIDVNGSSYTFCSKVSVSGLAAKATVCDHDKLPQPYKVPIAKPQIPDSFTLDLEFFAHQQEPNMKLTVPMDILADKGTLAFHMEFDLGHRQWAEVTIKDLEGNALQQAQFK